MTDEAAPDREADISAALGRIIADDGRAVLSDPRRLGNALSDLLPDGGRDTSLLVTASEVDVATILEEQARMGVDPTTAIGLARVRLAEERYIPAEACALVVGHLAAALGYGSADAATQLPGGEPPVTQPAPSAVPPPPPAAGLHDQPTVAAGSTPAAPAPAPAPTPGPAPAFAARKRRRPLIAVAGIVAVVIMYVIVAAAVSAPPFSKAAKHKANPELKATPAGKATLISLLPDQEKTDPAGPLIVGTCSDTTGDQSGSVGLIASNDCSLVPGHPQLDVDGYVFDTAAHYQNGLTSELGLDGLVDAGLSSTCPPATGANQGKVAWSGPNYPAMAGQDLYCIITPGQEGGPAPRYIWSIPAHNAFFVLSTNDVMGTLALLDAFWKLDGPVAA